MTKKNATGGSPAKILIWTVCFTVFYYFLLLGLFNFNILMASDWSALSAAHLRGIRGLAFAVVLSAMIPLYLASYFVIKRTKKLPIDLPNIFSKKKAAIADDIPPPPEPEAEISFPDELPAEIMSQYLLMRRGNLAKGAVHKASPLANQPSPRVSDNQNLNVMPITAARPVPGIIESVSPPTPVSENIRDIAGALPLPEDFSRDGKSDAPMFKDLNFGIASVAAPTFNDINFTKPVREVGSSFGELEKYLRNAGYAIEHETDIIVAKNGTKNFAIAVHDDRDTWVADDQTWFAAGKQKDSPVKLAMAASEKNNAIPVLYLAAKNIMDLDKWRAKWKSEGVKVIEILSEL